MGLPRLPQGRAGAGRDDAALLRRRAAQGLCDPRRLARGGPGGHGVQDPGAEGGLRARAPDRLGDRHEHRRVQGLWPARRRHLPRGLCPLLLLRLLGRGGRGRAAVPGRLRRQDRRPGPGLYRRPGGPDRPGLYAAGRGHPHGPRGPGHPVPGLGRDRLAQPLRPAALGGRAGHVADQPGLCDAHRDRGGEPAVRRIRRLRLVPAQRDAAAVARRQHGRGARLFRL